MSHIAVIITKLFEDSEYVQPATVFREKGHELTHIGFKAGETVRGKAEHTPVTVDKALGDANPADYDALLIPGGFSPDQLRADPKAVEFVRHFFDQGKPVFAICHGPQLLINAEVVKGRRLTGWKSIAIDLKNAGAQFEDKEVVVDGNLVTSRQPDDLPAFIEESLKKLAA